MKLLEFGVGRFDHVASDPVLNLFRKALMMVTVDAVHIQVWVDLQNFLAPNFVFLFFVLVLIFVGYFTQVVRVVVRTRLFGLLLGTQIYRSPQVFMGAVQAFEICEFDVIALLFGAFTETKALGHLNFEHVYFILLILVLLAGDEAVDLV